MVESHFCRPPSQYLLHFPGFFGWLFLWWFFPLPFFFFFFSLSCYQISSHLTSSDWKPKLPTLGCNELILCVCCLVYVLSLAPSWVKPLIWNCERVWNPLCPSFSTTLLQELLKAHSAAPDLASKSPFKCASKQACLINSWKTHFILNFIKAIIINMTDLNEHRLLWSTSKWTSFLQLHFT